MTEETTKPVCKTCNGTGKDVHPDAHPEGACADCFIPIFEK